MMICGFLGYRGQTDSGRDFTYEETYGTPHSAEPWKSTGFLHVLTLMSTLVSYHKNEQQ